MTKTETLIVPFELTLHDCHVIILDKIDKHKEVYYDTLTREECDGQ